MRHDPAADGHLPGELVAQRRGIVDNDRTRALLNGYEMAFHDGDRTFDAGVTFNAIAGAATVGSPGIPLPRSARRIDVRSRWRGLRVSDRRKSGG